MRQARLSIGCQNWQDTVKRIGPAAAGVLLYLRTLMRTMQTAEITVTLTEIARTLGIDEESTEDAIKTIVMSGYLNFTGAQAAQAAGGACTWEVAGSCRSADGSQNAERAALITLTCPEEAKAQADMFRKRAARLLARHRGQSKETCGQSGVVSGKQEDLSVKQYTTDFFMIYHGPSEEKEKAPHTPEKEKTLTEFTGRASMHTRDRDAELPADPLEAEYIDIVGSWPGSLRTAIRAEKEDVREAFYLFVRTRQDDAGKVWTADQVRIAWLAARRIQQERRADSILAAAMGGWKTIRDVGSGMYFEKETGRIVSLVRGTVETRQNPGDQANADLAVRLARNLRRD